MSDGGSTRSDFTEDDGPSVAPEELQGGVEDLRDAEPALLLPEEHGRAMQRAQAHKAHQQNQLREKFFAWARWIVSGTLISNFAIFGVYMGSQWHHISDTVMTGWISATVIEVLGLAYIIARYLFDQPTAGNAEKKDEKGS
jgi:hypothetical protein